MRRQATKLGFAALAVLTISACGSDDGDKAPAATGFAAQLRSFGSAFETAFNANPNSEPYTPADGDVPALTLTAEPSPID